MNDKLTIRLAEDISALKALQGITHRDIKNLIKKVNKINGSVAFTKVQAEVNKSGILYLKWFTGILFTVFIIITGLLVK